MAVCRHPRESVGEVGSRKRETQGLLRPSGPRYTVNSAKKRHDDAQRSVGRFVMSYFSNGGRKNVDITVLTSLFHPHSF